MHLLKVPMKESRQTASTQGTMERESDKKRKIANIKVALTDKKIS